MLQFYPELAALMKFQIWYISFKIILIFAYNLIIAGTNYFLNTL